MSVTDEHQDSDPRRIGFGLPPHVMRTLLADCRVAKHVLFHVSHGLREEVLHCEGALTFKPLPQAASSSSTAVVAGVGRTLCKVLQHRKRPLKLILDLRSLELTSDHILLMISELAATSRPNDAQGVQTCCVRELVLKVRSLHQTIY